MGIALHEWVDEGQCQAAEGHQNGHPVGQQHQQEGHQHQTDKQPDRFALTHPAGGQGALMGTFHMAIDMAVGKVIDHATG